MITYTNYKSPIGNILLKADEVGLTELRFDLQEYTNYENNTKFEPLLEQTNIHLKQSKLWLDIYFSGHEPSFFPDLHLIGTPFQIEVWKLVQKIPYGSTTSYSNIAQEIAKFKGIKNMAAQAVGYAVGLNNISIIIPCHRVIGKNGKLTGYSGGIEKKKYLLNLEKSVIT